MAKIGRPPILDKAMKRDILATVREGQSVRLAARQLGCDEGTIRYAAKNDAKFGEALDRARGRHSATKRGGKSRQSRGRSPAKSSQRSGKSAAKSHKRSGKSAAKPRRPPAKSRR